MTVSDHDSTEVNCFRPGHWPHEALLDITLCCAVAMISPADGGESSPEASVGSQPVPKGVISNPDKPVQECEGCTLPAYRFPSRNAFLTNLHRHHGDLSGAGPNVDMLRPPRYGGGALCGKQVIPRCSELDIVLLSEWDVREAQRLLRFDVSACPARVLPGQYGFIAQWNEGRFTKHRHTEFREDKVVQAFDARKFNFSKVLQREALVQFLPHGSKPAVYEPAAKASATPNLVLVNVSPVEYGHVLLVPHANAGLPQQVTPDTLLLALRFIHETQNPYFRLCFNSLKGLGTVNNLHFQGLYLAAPFAIERAPTVPLPKAAGRSQQGGVRVVLLGEYPVRSLVFEAGGSLPELADVVGKACQRLAAQNIGHNLLVSEGGARIFLWPSGFEDKEAAGMIPKDVLDLQIRPGGWEVAGHMIFKQKEEYEGATQEWTWRLLSYSSLDEEGFMQAARVALGGDGGLKRSLFCACCC